MFLLYHAPQLPEQGEHAPLLHAALTECTVLILTTFGRPGYLRRAMESGASGFLVKDVPPRTWPRPSGGRFGASGSLIRHSPRPR